MTTENALFVRSMELLGDGGVVIYQSQFDPQTGTLMRVVETPKEQWGRLPWRRDKEFRDRYDARLYGEAFSPVPETVDVSITNRCGFGCTYCYQDSQPRGAHASKDLIEKIITGFDQPPYQMAIGGGEPTLHPDFSWILKRAHELGTVPNYTTNGNKLTPAIIKATNEFCGGVAMTYHAFKGIDWFVEHYNALRRALTVQVNVHLITDRDVATNLTALLNKREEIGPLRLVLLAYYPDVGRANINNMLTRKAYERDLPPAIAAAQQAGYQIAFSEGLLPYFLSRPELGVNTKFAMRSEGLFSCYFNSEGSIFHSSFDFPSGNGTVFNTKSQELWDKLNSSNEPVGAACYQCKYARRCSTPHNFHYLACAYAEHNEVSSCPK